MQSNILKRETEITENVKLLFSCMALSIFSGLLLALAYPPYNFSFLVFFSLVILLIISKISYKNNLKLRYTFLLFWLSGIITNIIVTYWLYNTVVILVLLIHCINPIFIAFILTVYSKVYRELGKKVAYGSLVLLWICFEYLHHHWQLSYPFLTLGNVLAGYPELIQWYSYTSVLGGSLWILLVSIGFYEIINSRNDAKKNKFLKLALTSCMLFLPILVSLTMFYQYEEKGDDMEVMAIHPSTDCYTEKYTLSSEALTEKYITLIDKAITKNTKILFLPETAITHAGWYGNQNSNESINLLKNWLEKYPNTEIISGGILYKQATETEAKNPNVNQAKDKKYWYYAYNVALRIDTTHNNLIHCKQHLVPFEEKIPYENYLGFTKGLVEKLGFWHFSNNIPQQNTFFSKNGNIAPLICFESLFGQSAAKAVQEGATAICVLLNEGWYKHKTGATQFMYFATLRAIENRRAVVRSSNNGYSCFINQRGEITQKQGEMIPQALIGKIKLNKEISFYTKHPNLIGKLACIGLVIVLFFILKKYIDV
jgi:apolipoprotein N-acyltransferase